MMAIKIDQEHGTNVNGIFFDAYFMQDEIPISNIEAEIQNENTLYLKIKSQNRGYIKQIKISFLDDKQEPNPNFEMLENKSEQVVSQDITNNTIELQQVNKGETLIVPIQIKMKQQEQIKPEDFSKETTVRLEAIYTNTQAKNEEVQKDCKISVKWNTETQITLNQEISKYLIDDNGILLQTKIHSGIVENKLPIKKTQIQIKAPNIQGIKPEEIKVYSNTTISTNGDETALEFKQENWKYENENILIEVNNEINEQGYVKWKRNNVQDEYCITYHYPKEVLEKIRIRK